MYVMRRTKNERDGDGRDSGMPRARASVAAREKFSTDVTEITVDAKHKLSDLSSIGSGASPEVDSGTDINKQASGEIRRKTESNIEDD